jgi:sugar phosphate isomerase/epimerase
VLVNPARFVYNVVMDSTRCSRRNALAKAGLLAGVAALGPTLSTPSTARGSESPQPFLFCLNTATIRGQKLGIVKEIEIAAKAGYNAIEPWVDSIEDYVRQGGSLPDLKKRLGDAGLTVEGAIGFAEWAVDDDARRKAGLERARREMDMLAQIGARRTAAPPAGATDLPKLDLVKTAQRYRALLEIGDSFGIVPELELWGFSQNLNRFGECVGVAIETGHPKACVLLDVFHLYKGGSDFHGLSLLGSSMVQVLHMNDYPADPPRDKINDSYRVYPGDGIAPLDSLIRLLSGTGGGKVLSLELFSQQYWSRDPFEVARTGLEKMKTAASKARAQA